MGPVEPVESGCIRTLVRLNTDGSLDEGFRLKEPCQPTDVVEQRVPDLIAILRDESMVIYKHGGPHSENETIYLSREGEEIRGPGLSETLRVANTMTAVSIGDGGILLGGDEQIVKFWPDGSIDQTFHGFRAPWFVKKIALQGEKILISDGRGDLVRLNGDGSRDLSFRTPVLNLYSD